MKRHQLGSFLGLRYLGVAFLAVLAFAALVTRVEAVCVIPQVTVKDVKGVAIADSEKMGSERGLSGVTVRLVQERAGRRHIVAESVTDLEGRFDLGKVRPGIYELSGEAEGFVTAVGPLRVSRLTLRQRGTLFIVLPHLSTYDMESECGGWIESQK